VDTLTLSAAKPEQTLHLAEGPVEYSVRIKAVKEPEALGTVPVSDATFRPLTQSNLFFDPGALSGRRVVRIVAGAVDFATIARVSGTLAVADAAPHSFQLDSKHPEVTVPVWGADSVHMRAEFVLPAGARIPIERVIGPMEPVVLVNQPAGRFSVVSVMLQDPANRYSSVSVTLEASPGAPRQNLVLDAASPMGTWSAPRDAGAPSSFRYKLRKALKDSSVIDSEWVETSGSLLVVGDLDIRLETVQGFLLGATETLGGLVRLTPLNPPEGIDAVQEILLDPGQTAFTADLVFARSAPFRYTVTGEVFLESETIEIPLREESSEVLLLPFAKSGTA
jgi:hypothetical protein